MTFAPTASRFPAQVALVLFIAHCPLVLSAQPRSQIVPIGSTVRAVVSDPSQSWIEGSVRTIDVERLTLASTGSGLRHFRWTEVDSLFVLHKRHHGTRGAAIGLLAGASIAGLFVLATFPDECHPSGGLCEAFMVRNRAALALAGGGGLIGALVGLLIGELSPTRRWERVDLNVHLQPVTAPPTGADLRLSPSFRLVIPIG